MTFNPRTITPPLAELIVGLKLKLKVNKENEPLLAMTINGLTPPPS